MADIATAINLVAANFPDNTANFTTNAKAREVLNYMILLMVENGLGGGLAQSVTFTVGTGDIGGNTYQRAGASSSLLVVKNNVPLQIGYSFNPANSIWAFAEAFAEGDVYTFLYQ